MDRLFDDYLQPGAAAVPDAADLATLQRAAASCTRCHLHEHATQTVFGEGAAHAPLMLVGEQPGDVEDRRGRPFVGPAGQVLDDGLALVGIDRDAAYVTNAVKHFKFEARGKRRIHSTPNAEEIRACRPWLEAELAVVEPRVVVCLGATVAKALLGPSFRVTRQRGTFVDWDLPPLVTATVHPSSILRAPPERRQSDMDAFVADLRAVADALAA